MESVYALSPKPYLLIFTHALTQSLRHLESTCRHHASAFQQSARSGSSTVRFAKYQARASIGGGKLHSTVGVQVNKWKILGQMGGESPMQNTRTDADQLVSVFATRSVSGRMRKSGRRSG